MNLLLLLFVLAAIAGWTSIYFLRSRDVSVRAEDTQSAPCGQSAVLEAAGPRFLGHAIFSEADWDFIRKEGSPSLTKLFTEERRALATQWLNDRAARIQAVRAKHLENSRYSQDLNVLAEVKLLVLFQYLIALCRCMLLVVRVAQPTTPRTLALHFEKMAGRAGLEQGAAVAYAPVEELPRSRP